MGAAASTVFAAAVESPPPFDEHMHEGRLLLEHKKLSAQTLNSVAAYIYFSGVHTLVLAGLLSGIFHYLILSVMSSGFTQGTVIILTLCFRNNRNNIDCCCFR
jgi:hypothetical protein